jgi:dTDP-4-dehydrorhamnose reductase
MTDLLVVGANGQVGWEVSRQAQSAGLACRSLSRGELDITNRDLVLRTIEQIRPLVVVNGAAYTAVDKAESDSDTAYAVNRDGAKFLAEACAAVGALIIHLSTDYVFDGSKGSPYKESDPAAPLGVYGASKLAGEHSVRAHCPKHVILRTSWIYGVHGHNFVRTMLRLGRVRDSLRVVDDQLGSPTFAGDLGRAIMKLVLDLRGGAWPTDGFGTFHCAAQGTTTWCGFAREIFAQTARSTVVEAIATKDYPTPARRPAYSVLDCSKIARVHRVALSSWQVALADTLKELRSGNSQFMGTSFSAEVLR